MGAAELSGADRLTAEDVAGLGASRVYLVDTVDSTLDEIHRLAVVGAPRGTLVVADEQTAGRGQQGRVWHSPPGGLWLGWLERPPVPVVPGALAIRVGLATAEALAGTIGSGASVALKWPNDVLLDGKKVAGTLCEARWQGGGLRWIAVGIGVNLGNPIPEEMAETATGARGVTRRQVLERLIPALAAGPPASPTLTADELKRFALVDALRGRALARPVAGVAAGLDPEGSLLVDTGVGAVAVRTGPVRLA